MSNPDTHQATVAEILSLNQRDFSKKVDGYIRHEITEMEEKALESPELLLRMHLDLISTEKGVRGQYALLKSDFDLEMIDAGSDKAAQNRALSKYRKSMKPKQRFVLGLNDTVAHVGWLMWKTYPREFALTAERDQLIVDLDTARKALNKHRDKALQDEEGFLEREESLWKECAVLIGPSNLD